MAFAIFMTGCGDTTTINGYSEEQVSELLASNKELTTTKMLFLLFSKMLLK